MQSLRIGAIGLFRGRREAIVQGTLPRWRAALDKTESEARVAMDRLDAIDTGAGMILTVIVTLVTATALGLGGALVARGDLDPALAAIGVFVALALAETLVPLRRGLAEIGRMRDAAARVMAEPPAHDAPLRVSPPQDPIPNAVLEVRRLSLSRPGWTRLLLHDLSFAVMPGETLAIRGASGAGKSTLLDVIAGLDPAAAGEALVLGRPVQAWDAGALRDVLLLVPQRAALLSGTIMENLALATPDVTEEDARAALRAVALADDIDQRGGLNAALGEGGAGLSGGQARRLVLARAILRRPKLLMLDEPTEGLDGPTARQVLAGIRNFLPDAAIVTASHRAAELDMAHRVISLESYIPEL